MKKDKNICPTEDSHNIHNKWLNKYEWLMDKDGGIKCQISMVSDLKLNNTLVSECGCKNYRTSTLTMHEKSGEL